METPFRPAPLEALTRWIFRDLEDGDAVLGIPKANVQIPDAGLASTMFGHVVAAPLGVAAGPHTQLAQNIVASWLCGARFIELKTVQILDEIQVARPCIDAQDETFNCEWSQELKLEQSYGEYLNAWVLLHALAHRLGLPGPGVHFNMSIGYNLEGILNPRVQTFIQDMRDARAYLPEAVATIAKVYPAVRDLDIPFEISNHVTLSTMHGCPPAEIERIARYFLTELGVHTWVKLNPTLLGPERLRSILNDTLGFDIEVPDEAFGHDPKFADAMAMVRSLDATARDLPVRFGLKLSNTLEVVNHRPVFPATEKMMYLSGRALHPLTLTLAQLVTEALGDTVPISFCGGADATNFSDLVADGLGPITVCTDLLKPGGYARLQQYLVNLQEAMAAAGAATLEAYTAGGRTRLAGHALRAAGEERYTRRARPLAFKGSRKLGHFDCVQAPCMEACPAHQNIPDYLWHVAHREPAQAMDVILRTNPQPGITGSVCDHPCTSRCVRNFFDAPVAIRELKRYAFTHATPAAPRPAAPLGIKVAVIGAGPAGLSAAYYLGRMGFQVEVFEAKTSLGGMVSGVIPGYRLSALTLGADLDRLRNLGVTFHLGQALGRDFTLQNLRSQFPYVFLGVGAQQGKRLGIPGEDTPGVLDALEFLDRVRAGAPPELGGRVLIIGGGNSAMDAARSARRLVKDGEVTLVYRRTRAQMPADPAEVHDCIEEGIGLRDLLAPAGVLASAGRVQALVCTPMTLGERDASGRPRPVPVDGPVTTLEADTIITAISQEPVLDFLAGLAVERRKDGTLAVDALSRETTLQGLFAGGDAVHGPASVIQAVADGRAAAQAIALRHGVHLDEETPLAKGLAPAAAMARKARRLVPQAVPVLPLAEREGFREVAGTFDTEAAVLEAGRCLDCDEVCSLCVTVCPNRANLAYTCEPLTLAWPRLVARDGQLTAVGEQTWRREQTVQTLNIADFCNGCGNCDTFCPAAGAPYRDKPRLWLDPAGFESAVGDAFHVTQTAGGMRIQARLDGHACTLHVGSASASFQSAKLSARFAAGPWRPIGWEPGPALAEGEEADLSAAATLLRLIPALDHLPYATV